MIVPTIPELDAIEIRAVLIYAVWILGWICRDQTPQAETLSYFEGWPE